MIIVRKIRAYPVKATITTRSELSVWLLGRRCFLIIGNDEKAKAYKQQPAFGIAGAEADKNGRTRNYDCRASSERIR